MTVHLQLQAVMPKVLEKVPFVLGKRDTMRFSSLTSYIKTSKRGGLLLTIHIPFLLTSAASNYSQGSYFSFLIIDLGTVSTFYLVFYLVVARWQK